MRVLLLEEDMRTYNFGQNASSRQRCYDTRFYKVKKVSSHDVINFKRRLLNTIEIFSNI